MAWQNDRSPAQLAAEGGKREELKVTTGPANSEADWILKAMVAVAASDGGLDAREMGLIQQVYRDQSGRSLTADEVARAAGANARGDALAEFDPVCERAG